MLKHIKIDENPKMIRLENESIELNALESALLNGDKLSAKVRCRIAKETINPEIIRLCLQDSAITVVAAAKENPLFISQMNKENSNVRSTNRQSKQSMIQDEIKSVKPSRVKKTNIWLVVSAILFIVVCILSFVLYDSSERISHLEYKLYINSPKTYYTKYSEQTIYYKVNDAFIDSNCILKDSDTSVIVYLERDGYGMTEYGWVPMDCLKW